MSVNRGRRINDFELARASAGTASSRERHLNRYLWALLAVTNLVDVLASRRAFGLGIGELNPFIESLLARYGLVGLGMLKLFWISVLLILLPYIRGWLHQLLMLACLVYLALTVVHIARLSPLL